MIESALTVTHQIISLARGQTSGSHSPMWRCETLDSERVNIFQHADPVKDSYRLFAGAGYAADLQALEMGQKLRWSEHPIGVTLRKDGNWWNIVAVAPRPAGACPDAASQPNAALYRQAAQAWAEALLIVGVPVIIWDSETTGLTEQDEIISLAAIDVYGETLLNLRLRPRDLNAVARSTEIHGITADDLAGAPTFPDMYPTIRSLLHGRIWAIYNSGFDTRMLDQLCRLYDCAPIRSVGVVDAMQIFAEFKGDWNFEYDQFRSHKLTAAAEHLGVEVVDAHDALGDCKMTLAILEKMADWQPE